jgi:hypothetical protein
MEICFIHLFRTKSTGKRFTQAKKICTGINAPKSNKKGHPLIVIIVRIKNSQIFQEAESFAIRNGGNSEQ